MTALQLTEKQHSALQDAKRGLTIYGEDPAYRNAQMPTGSACYDTRTVESLASKGLLAPDGRAGYVITPRRSRGSFCRLVAIATHN